MSTIHATLSRVGDWETNVENSWVTFQRAFSEATAICPRQLQETGTKNPRSTKSKKKKFAPKKKKKRNGKFLYSCDHLRSEESTTVPILIALHLPLRRNWPWFPPGPNQRCLTSTPWRLQPWGHVPTKKIRAVDTPILDVCKNMLFVTVSQPVKCSTKVSSQLQTCICIASRKRIKYFPCPKLTKKKLQRSLPKRTSSKQHWSDAMFVS